MSGPIVPGNVTTAEGSVTINEGRQTATVTVANTGDRPAQVGSHFHFAEANAALAFDRETALGMRLNVPAGTAVRFEPGDETTVELVAFGGERTLRGLNGVVNGEIDDRAAIVERLREGGFATMAREDAGDEPGDGEP